MYLPKFKTFQILIPMLKEYNISHIVISPGSRMREFVLAVEEDPFFTTYNVTDERSASYFAIGISQQLNVPVVITCTSSTATANYVPGVTEAYYQGVPIVVLTGDRDPYMLGQQEDQMINQVEMYDRVVRKSVTLPIIKDNADIWYCERLLNEALLELNHRKMGPVHINVPVPAVITWEQDKSIDEYPDVKVIKRYTLDDRCEEQLSNCVEKLRQAQKILILAGQNTTDFDVKLLSDFFSKYNCIIHAEHMGNISSDAKVNIAALSEGIIFDSVFDDFMPDILISFHGTLGITRVLKESIRKRRCQHWLIDVNGDVIDAYKNLTLIFECKPDDFFLFFNKKALPNQLNNRLYYNKWMLKYNDVKHPDIPYSNVFVIKYLLKFMPSNSLLHLSILNSVRIAHYFELPPDTKVYANIGTDGIDGCMSTFLGQSFVTDRRCFLIIGDLSFFYDMSSLRIKHIKNNCRIILINNFGGNEFYLQPIMPTTDQGLGAKHKNIAKGWAESVGFHYMSASSKEEYLEKVREFTDSESNLPVLFEVFTDQMTDRETINKIKHSYHAIFDKNAVFKDSVKSIIGESTVNSIKKMIGKK